MDLPELTDDETTVLESVAYLETEGADTGLNEVAERAGMTPDRARAVLSRLLHPLGLVSEVPPGGGVADVTYITSGRAGAGGRPAADEAITDLPAQLARALEGLAFPAGKDGVARRARDRQAPLALVELIEELPDGARFVNIEELAGVLADRAGMDS